MWDRLVLSMTLSDWLTTSLAAWAGFTVWRSRPERSLRRNRRRELRRLGVSRAAVKQRSALLLQGLTPSVADELSWLGDHLSLPAGVGFPFGCNEETVTRVAEAYARCAARLERGELFGSPNAPVLQRESRLCRAVAQTLRSRLTFEDLNPVDCTLTIPHRETELVIRSGTREQVMPADAASAVRLQARDLVISYRRDRLGALAPSRHLPDPSGTLTTSLLALNASEVQAIQEFVHQARFFDGILPRLVGWRVVRDAASGRQAYHLSLAEVTYSAVVADHYPGHLVAPGAPPRAVSGARSQLLTLALMLTTSCGHLVFVRRAAGAGSHPGRVGPTVSGNLEFGSADRPSPDVDPLGLPDPIRALVRESSEELGIVLQPEQVTVCGLAAFSNTQEVNSNLLFCLAAAEVALDELPTVARHADLVDGSWEVGSHAIALKLPRTPEELGRSIDWLMGSTELTPHATLAGLGALGCLNDLADIWQRAARSPGRRHPVARPVGLVSEVDLR